MSNSARQLKLVARRAQAVTVATCTALVRDGATWTGSGTESVQPPDACRCLHCTMQVRLRRAFLFASRYSPCAGAGSAPYCSRRFSDGQYYEYESVVSDAKITSLLQRGRRARTGIVNRKHPNQSPRLYVMAATREQRLCPVLNFLIQSARTWMVAALPTRTECGSTQCESRVVAGSQGHRCARPLDG